MKGFTRDHKFIPITPYTKKGTRKSRDQNAKSEGVRLARIFQDDPDAVEKLERKLEELEKQKAYWKGLKPLPRTYGINEPDGAKRSFMLPNLNATIRDVRMKIAKIKERQEKNIGLERKTTFKDGRKVFYYQEVKQDERKARDTTKNMPYKIMNAIMQDFNTTRISISSFNPKWNLYEVYTDDGRFYIFPDEESALKFGRQSIRDTATEYIPDEGSESYDEWKGLSQNQLVDKIIEQASDYGQTSELGAIAKSVASYDGQYHTLPDGWIAFRID